MSAKAYVLLNVVHEKQEQVVRALRGKPGVLMVDVVEGPPDVVVVLRARDRQKLAKLTVQALASVETMTEGLQLLPTRNRLSARGVGKWEK
jgi:DNA-binding Lrp family transcriptional regulator